MIEVEFQHWKYTFSEEDLTNGSPNRRKDIAKSKLCTALQKATLVSKTIAPMFFEEEQIICANEAFPEAAIADPLADIEVWNEWRNGIRIFPYPGKYAKLSITHQLPKTSSTSSIGVIGEIMAGLFGQAIVGYDVLVRVIHAWPDFIFYPQNNRHGFLEAKAFTPQPDSYLNDYFKVPKNVLGECLLNAIHHLAIDPYVKMWYAFTEIQQVVPVIKFSVNFFELEVSDERRTRYVYSIPAPVIDGLAERAIQVAIASLDINLDDFKNKNKSSKRRNSENRLTNSAMEKINYVMNTLNLDINEEIKQKILNSIQQQVENIKSIEPPDDEYSIVYSDKFSNKKNIFQPDNIKIDDLEEGIQFIRNIGDKKLYQIKLSPNDRYYNISYGWKSDFQDSNKCYIKIDSHKFWRCGNSIFFLCREEEKELLFSKIKKEFNLN